MTLSTDTNPALLDNSVWFSRLETMAFTEVSGADNKRFLQGQLSCNVLKLDESNSLRGALCSLKGRVIADLRLVQMADTLLMVTRLDLQEKIISTLNKYRVFFKTTLVEANTRYCVFGIGGVGIDAVASDLGITLPDMPDSCTRYEDAIFIRMPATSMLRVPRYLMVFARESEQAVTLSLRLQEALIELPELLWTVSEIRTGQAHPEFKQSELFTPQLLNYDINGVIDFKKGCYTGQEIVARMFYKAEAKRRLFYVKSNSSAGHADGNELATPAEDMVTSVKFADGSHELLAILNCEQAILMNSVTSFN